VFTHVLLSFSWRYTVVEGGGGKAALSKHIDFWIFGDGPSRPLFKQLALTFKSLFAAEKDM